MKEFLIYTALRLGLFAAALAVILGLTWLVVDEVSETQVLIAAAAAFLLSGLASYRLLHGHRELLARKVEERATRATAKFEELKAKEDQ